LPDVQSIETGVIETMNILGKIQKHWGWTGLKGIEIVGRNEFGNILVSDENQAYWRISPEDLICEIVAENPDDYFKLIEDEAFQVDWKMSNLVELAREHLGSLKQGWAYYLVVPATFGGRYDATNIRSAPLDELIGHTGDWALAIKDLPEGAQIELRVI
jgi:hypothetical protein